MDNEQTIAELLVNLKVTLAKRPAGSTEPLRVPGVELDITPSNDTMSVASIVNLFTEGSCLHALLVIDWLQAGLQLDGTDDASQGVHPSLRDMPSMKNMTSEVIDKVAGKASQMAKDYSLLKELDRVWMRSKTVYTPFSPFIPVVDTLQSICSDPTYIVPFPKRFATQLYLDISLISVAVYRHDREAGYLIRILDDVSLKCHNMLLSVSDCLSHVPDMSNETLSRTELLTMLENLRCIIPFPHGRDAMLKTYEFNPLHPWAASVLYGRARSMLLDYVCELEEREPFIYMAAYLYAAVDQGLREFGVVSNGGKSMSWWPLMDKYLQFVGKERLFYGKDPGSMSDVYKSFMLQMGMSGVDMKLRLAPPNGREAAIWHGMTARVRARVERDGPVFSMAPLVDCALSPAFKEFMQRFSSATMSDKDVAEHLHHLGDCIVQVPGADDMSNKHQLKSLGRSDYLKVIQSELRQHQPMYMLSLDMLHLRAQSCRVLKCLSKAFSPHMSQLLPGFPSFLIGSDDFKMQVSLFITVLSSPDGQGAAYHIARAIKVYKEKAAERRPVIQGILKKIRGYVREMMVADDVKRDI